MNKYKLLWAWNCIFHIYKTASTQNRFCQAGNSKKNGTFVFGGECLCRTSWTGLNNDSPMLKPDGFCMCTDYRIVNSEAKK